MVTPSELGLNAGFLRPAAPRRIGIVALGGISAAHQTAYREAGWPVVAGADIDPDRRAWATREFGLLRTTDDWRAVVDDPEVEVVSLLTQPDVRLEVVQACAALGKPILVEKPLAASLTEARAIVQTAEHAKLPTAVSQNYRWFPAPFLARQILAQGRIGTPFFVGFTIFGTQDRDLAGHPFYSRCDDFLTVQWNTHLADLIRCFAGRDASRVLTRGRRAADQTFVSDNLLLSVHELGEGSTGQVLHSELVRSSATADAFRIDGPEGTLEGGIWSPWLTLTQGTERIQIDVSGLAHSMSGPMGELLACLETGAEPSVSFDRNFATLATVHAEQKSLHAGGTWIEPEAR